MNKAVINLIERKELTQEQWIEILEQCRIRLNPVLDKFTLKEFQDMSCLCSEENVHFYHSPGEDICERSIDPAIRTTYGITDCPRIERLSRKGDSGDRFGWALTKTGLWSLIHIRLRLIEGFTNTAMTREQAYRFTVRKSSVHEILAVTGAKPYTIWRILMMEVKNWEGKRRKLHEAAVELSQEFESTDMMLTHFMLGIP